MKISIVSLSLALESWLFGQLQSTHGNIRLHWGFTPRFCFSSSDILEASHQCKICEGIARPNSMQVQTATQASRLAPDAEHVRVVAVGSHQWAVHILTQEVVPLQESQEGWNIATSQGFAYIYSAGVVKWASTIFQRPLYLVAGQEGYFYREGGQVKSWEQLFRMRILDVSVTIRMARNDVVLRVFAEKVRKNGVHCFWSALSLHKELGFMCQKVAGRWAQHGWQRWCAFITGVCQLSEHHMVLKHSRQAEVSDETVTGSAGTEFRGFSTHALVALLARWCQPSAVRGGLGKEEDRAQSSAFLHTLLDKVSSALPAEMMLFMDAECKWNPPLPFVGKAGFKVTIVNGRVDTELWARRGGVLGQLVQLQYGSGNREKYWSLASMLEAISFHADAFIQSLFRQLVWTLGSAIDVYFFEQLQARPSTTLLKDMTDADRNRATVRYFLASQRAFQGADVLHVSMDASTVGGKSLMFAFVGSPNNLVCTAAPQELWENNKMYWLSFLVVQDLVAVLQVDLACIFQPGSGVNLYGTLGLSILGRGGRKNKELADGSNFGFDLSTWAWELRSHIADSFVDRLAGPPEAQADHQATWVQRARLWLKKRKPEGEEFKPQKFRKKACQWLVALENVLVKTAGKSLDAFTIDRAVAPRSWPYLGVTPDQGSDGVCAGWYLKHREINAEFFYDISHGIWNDQQLAVQAVGLKAFTHLLVVVMNLAHSPWNSSARFQQLKDSTEEYLPMLVECPLLQHYLSDVVSELGLGSWDWENRSAIEAVSEHLAQDWNQHFKGTQVKMCRFGNWTDRAEEFLTGYTWAMLRIMHYGLQERLFTAEAFEGILKQTQSSNNEGPERAGVRDSNTSIVQGFRKANKNNMQLAAVLLTEPLTKFRVYTLTAFARPIRRFHGRQNVTLRSSHETLEWFKEQFLAGHVHSSLQETVALLSTTSLLDEVGFKLEFSAQEKDMTVLHPPVAEQNEMALLACKYVCHLVAFRSKRMLYLTDGWTGMQARFLSDVDAQLAEVADMFMQEWLAFEEAKKQKGAFWQKLVGRSYWNTGPALQLRDFLVQNNGRVSEEMKAHVTQRLSGLAQSKLCEDAVNRARQVEDRSRNKQQLPARRVWEKLIDTKLAHTVYRYDEVEWSGVVAPANRPLPAGFFKAEWKKVPKWIPQVITKDRKPKWFSTDAQGANMLMVDRLLLLEGYNKKTWGEIAHSCKLAEFCSVGDMAMQPPGSTSWFISLGHVCGAAVLLWQAEPLTCDGKLLLKPDPKAAPKMMLLTESGWRASVLTWLSPWGQVVQKRVTPESVAQDGALWAIAGTAQPLLQCMASRGFEGVPISTLTWLLKYLGLELAADSSGLEKVLCLLHNLFPDESEANIMTMAGYRMGEHSCGYDEVMDLEDCADLVDAKDQQECAGSVKKIRDARSEIDEFKKAWSKKKRTQHEGASMASGSKKQVLKILNSSARTIRGEWPKGGLDDPAIAQSLMPDPVRVYRDAKNARWQVHYPNVGSRSRSWAMYGSRRALKLCMRWAWQEKLTRLGRENADCPVKGLMD
eukprot:6492139-Amphidinium_carterae.1